MKIEKAKRRMKLVAITAELAKAWLTNSGWHVLRVENGIPLSARFVRMFTDGHKNQCLFVFEDESFDEVEEGTVIPELWPVYSEAYGDRRAEVLGL